MSYEQYRDCYPDREIYELHREHLTDAELKEDAARIRLKMERLRIGRELGLGDQETMLLVVKTLMIEEGAAN